MAKIKLNLPSGLTVEKILINCFKSENNTYIVFDAENVGAMGLPIILVCKVENNRVFKIESAEEWTNVKACLKEIISGTPKEYVKIESSLMADEIFYTQLTLPLASFDALKKAYSVAETNNVSNEIVEGATSVSELPLVENPAIETPVVDNSENNIIQSVPQTLENNITPVVENVSSEPVVTNIENNLVSDVGGSTVLSNEAVANPLISDNIMPNLESQTNIATPSPLLNDNNEPVAEITNAQSLAANEPQGLPTNVVGEVQTAGIDYTADKEAFLKACENMFDALVAKFQAK